MNAVIPAFLQVADTWGASIGRASLVACVAIAAAWVIARWCTFLSPRVVCWIWRLACLKVLLALIWMQPVEIALLPARSESIAAPIFTALTGSTHNSQGELQVSFAPPPDPRAHAEAGRSFSAPTGLLLVAWLIGLVYCIARTARQWRSVRRLRTSSELCAADRVLCLCREEGQRLGVGRLPPLRLSRHVESPLLVGLWRPTIILPDRVEEKFDEKELRLMIAHELAHLKRHDLAWNWLPTLAAWLFFFHPLVWVMIRRWAEAQEAACDEMLIQRQVAAPADYGRLLVKLSACSRLESRAGLAAAGVLGAYRNLQRRILAMTRVKPFSARRLTLAATALSLAAIATIVPWRLVAAEDDTPPITATFIRARPQAPKEGTDPRTLEILERLQELGATPAEVQGDGLSIGIQSGWKGTAADLDPIAELGPFKLLYFDFDQVPAADVGKLMTKLKRPIDLLGLESLSDERLTALARLPACRSLMLGQETLSVAGFRRLSKMAVGVESLQLRGGVEDDSLVAVGQIHSLRELQLQQAKITDAGLAHLATLGNLEKLQLFDCRGVKGAGYASLAPIQSLRELQIFGPTIDAKASEALAKLTQLETLMLQPYRLPPDGLKAADVQALKNLKNLRTFSVMLQAPASDAAKRATAGAILAVASQLPMLRQLSAIGIIADADALAAVAKAPKLEELTLYDIALSDRLLTALGELKSMKQLNLASKGGVTEALWPKLTGLKQLTSLSLEGSSLDDANLAQLANLTALEKLNLPGSNITGTGLKALTNLKQLKWLTLSDSPFADDGAEALRELPTIEWLNLSKTKITDRAIDAIATLPRLFILNLDDTQVTADSLMKLRDLKKLSQVEVGARLSDADLAPVRAAMPEVDFSNQPFYNYGAQ
jgi:beta-lactamase regulating signal transducer with metallopeptidase domain